MSIVVDDDFLYEYMPKAERARMARIPPENELHHRFSRRFCRKMRALLRYERRSPKMRRLVHRCKVAAAVFAGAVFVTFGALMSVEAARTKIIEALTKVFEEFTSVRISADGGITDQELRPVAPAYVPEGYQVKDEESDDISHRIHYENEAGMVLDYTQDLLAANGYILDTEDAYTEKFMIGSQEVQVIMKENRNTYRIYWYDDFYFYWIGGEIELKDEILKMAESIIERKKF